MSTKSQRDFKRQMKELEKAGKVPQSYYAKRRVTYTSGVSILFVLFLLYRFGIIGYVVSNINHTFNMLTGKYDNKYNVEQSYNPKMDIVNEYYDKCQAVSEIYNDIYLRSYEKFFVSKDISLDVFEEYKTKLVKLETIVETDEIFLKELEENYKGILTVCTDMVEFTIKNYDNDLSEVDKNYFDLLTKKYITFTDKIEQSYNNLSQG